MGLSMSTERLIALCVTKGASFSLDWENGNYIDGRDALDAEGKPIPLDDIPPEKVKQGTPGFRIEIGSYVFNDEKTGEQALYPTLNEAIVAGWSLLGGLKT